ncbi:hypothetical protein HW090_14175 [Pseudomonas sp. ABC1]|uniref:hypothetical protein n=1 Tax=Pseudomonas sp. ABC1 TaxID=2748080 RepID=UPI0015C3B748|nr:hypothetical protein [Pseudomonas sp. ABC1]QLF94281.1 hypothetical protein HW090_14175 [Pseudomonas sp. ABC1]
MKVIAAHELHGNAQCDDKALKSALVEWLPNPPRRIDRLILLALLGAAPLKGQVRSDCGLYLASRHPARSTMGALLDAVCVQQRQPKPFEFVNSVSNAAGFHVAQQLGLEGPNLFIGAGPRVWRQLQQLATLDLADGSVSQALLLVVDEQADFTVQAALLENGPHNRLAEGFAELSASLKITRTSLP